MNIQLINKPKSDFSAMEQILFNRNIKPNDFFHYTHLTDKDINSPESLGEECLKKGAKVLLAQIQNNKEVIVVVDCDCDGYTSAALLINYLYHIFPTWTQEKIHWVLHNGKTHGLHDVIDDILTEYKDSPLIICPDSSSNDYEEHQRVKEAGGKVLVLDHHLAEQISKNAIIINNQLSDYPNKELSGVGVVWQFCRYLDQIAKTDEANNFLDLVALGNCGDMMSLISFETRYLIFEGFAKENIHNPFIEYMIDKNNFPLTKASYKSYFNSQACTSIGAAFFIVPFINAITRTGTKAEKELIFSSMIEHKAFTYIPEIKRNKPTGKEEYLVLQAVRVIGNVKNRQTRLEEAGMAKLEQKIKNEDMLKNKILLFLLEPGEIEAEIRGLIANKFMAKYQRPCAILTRTEIPRTAEKSSFVMYEGSMRGYTKTGLNSFKALLEKCPGVLYVEGHDNAAGLGIEAEKAEEFLQTANKLMQSFPTEPVYRVDYFFQNIADADKQKIIDIANLNDLWGQDFERAYVAIRFRVTSDNFSIMASNTLKITLPSGVTLIKFKGTDEDIENFTTSGWKEIDAYCTCNANEWNDTITPQLIIEDYEIIDSCKYIF